MTTIAIKVQKDGVLEVAADSQLTSGIVRMTISEDNRGCNGAGKIHKQIYVVKDTIGETLKRFPIIFGHTGDAADSYLIRDLFEPDGLLGSAIMESVLTFACPIRRLCSQKLQEVGISERVYDDSSFFVAYWSEVQSEFIIGVGNIKHSRLLLRPITLTPGDFHAMGSGREFALGAMSCGATAAKAIEVAKIYDIYTGGDVHVETLSVV